MGAALVVLLAPLVLVKNLAWRLDLGSEAKWVPGSGAVKGMRLGLGSEENGVPGSGAASGTL